MRWLCLVALLCLGSNCGTHVQVECDPKGEAFGKPGDCRVTSPAPRESYNVRWNADIVDADSDWRVAFDLVSADGSLEQDPPGPDWTRCRQANPDTPYWYKGPGIWDCSFYPDAPIPAGETVLLPAPRVECIAPGGCSGDPPRVLLHSLHADFGLVAWWYSDSLDLETEGHLCDVAQYPEGVRNPVIHRCVRRVSEPRGLSREFRVIQRRSHDQQDCLNCHFDNWQIKPGAQ